MGLLRKEVSEESLGREEMEALRHTSQNVYYYKLLSTLIVTKKKINVNYGSSVLPVNSNAF